ncbi:MAG: hypothetical protein KDD45_17820, partial [Bdellovibrionales bacterium]|nr:hypothetical protein [Bdellovibrionales bacterium]
STSTESIEERDEEIAVLKTNPAKHKTELCKNLSETGRCRYNQKCRFAHGAHELVTVPHIRTFRKKKCNGFWQKGCCSYGMRCQFSHD